MAAARAGALVEEEEDASELKLGEGFANVPDPVGGSEKYGGRGRGNRPGSMFGRGGRNTGQNAYENADQYDFQSNCHFLSQDQNLPIAIASIAAAMEEVTNNARVLSVSKTLNLLLVVLCFCFYASPAFGIVNDKCSACIAVALELEEALANERPRNSLDYRHRLNSEGQREGRVIDYRVSELRVVELLDGLCAKMKPYVPNQAGNGREFWIKVEGGVPDAPEMAFNRQATELHSRAIVEFCGRLLETTEEELTEKIRVGEVATGDVERVLCQELSKSCKEASATTPSADDVEDMEDDDDDDDVDVGEGFNKDKAVESAISYGSDGEL